MSAKNTTVVGIAGNWALFSKQIFGDTKPGHIQYRETRRAFYAGYVSAFTDMSNRIGNMSESQAMIAMDRINTEIAGYMQELLRGEG